MQCENEFCIYWNNLTCILEQISLDINGRCDACVMVTISEEYLMGKRVELLQRYEEEDKRK